ncbi:MAG: YbjN domain-containing protein [Deltaproteobacteria bacterium]|nr:YbjN domain-containing protein [Deltaproteobacteria bacterium]
MDQNNKDQNKRDIDTIDAYLRKMSFNPDELKKAPNIWKITQNKAEIFVIVAGGFIILQSKIMNCPKSNITTLYRKILELNDNVEQSLGAAFGINKNNEIILKMLRPMSNLGLNDFIYYLTSIAFVADQQMKELRGRFGD